MTKSWTSPSGLDHGIDVVHLVDTGRHQKRGNPKNFHVLEAVANHTDLKIDFTGGISADGDISSAYNLEQTTSQPQSIAITNPELFLPHGSCLLDVKK